MLPKACVVACLLLCLCVSACLVHGVSAASPAVEVDPPFSSASSGEVFSVNVNVTDVANLTAWQLSLYYLNAVINCTGVAEGPFLETGGGTYFGQSINNNYNSTHGRILAYSTLLGMTSVNGGGVTLTVTFKALRGGITVLWLVDTQLADQNVPPQSIPHQDFGGTVSVTGSAHDVAVESVTPSKTVIGQGISSIINVTIGNLGGYTETFNTAVSANQTIIATAINTTLTSGSFTTLTFSWNTTGVAYGNYTISAYADLPVDVNPTNNNCTGGLVTVSIPGDLNGDFKVSLADLVLLAQAYSSKPGDAKWNPNADINGSGKVDLSDLVTMATHYGQQFP